MESLFGTNENSASFKRKSSLFQGTTRKTAPFSVTDYLLTIYWICAACSALYLTVCIWPDSVFR